MAKVIRTGTAGSPLKISKGWLIGIVLIALLIVGLFIIRPLLTSKEGEAPSTTTSIDSNPQAAQGKISNEPGVFHAAVKSPRTAGEKAASLIFYASTVAIKDEACFGAMRCKELDYAVSMALFSMVEHTPPNSRVARVEIQEVVPGRASNSVTVKTRIWYERGNQRSMGFTLEDGRIVDVLPY
ncbi:MAG: hypothetical protein HYW95_02515 [Candidatus Wildermuthbacteria bacterium]|nr:hypothetical protein [Candidatus Wildermuthbacteria bacterium]